MIAGLSVQAKLLVLFACLGALGALGYLYLGGVALAVELALGLLAMALLVNRWRPRVPDYSAQLRDLQALSNLTPALGDLYFPFTGMAMEPSTLRDLLAYIQCQGARQIVECGAGVSSILIARVLSQGGEGLLVSIEQHAAWAEKVRLAAAAEGLTEWLTVVTAPIEYAPELGQEWYALEPVRTAVQRLGPIDMLIVDGPISVDASTRYPALPVFAGLLRRGAVVVLDDACRDAEAQVLQRWREAYACDLSMIYSQRGQAWLTLHDDQRSS